jgi:hypothetical protein
MHFFKISLNVKGSFPYKKIQLLNLCGLLCLALFFKGQMATGRGVYILDRQAVGQWQTGGNAPFAPALSITPYRAPGLFFDFENAPEVDPEPTGPDTEKDKGDTRTRFLLLLLSNAEQSRTKSTIAHCASSLQRRIIPPLFVLHHAWKHFPI